MRRTIATGVLALAVLVLPAPPPAAASGTPSVAKAEQVFEREVRRVERRAIRKGAKLSVSCRLRQTLKNERRYRCDYHLSATSAFECGRGNASECAFDGKGRAYWYRTKPWWATIG